jgi:ABC-type amino acid transport substrate-binding protein
VGERLNSASYAIALAKVYLLIILTLLRKIFADFLFFVLDKDDILCAQGAALRVGEHTYDYLTLVNWALLKLKYSGEIARLQQKWWTPPVTTPCTA